MQISQILFYILIAFIGYAVGRIGYIYWGYMKTPHHWIYGLILMIGGLFVYKYPLGISVFYLGAGFFINDLRDFLRLKFFGPDGDGKKKFWGID